jgi:hypothetical protein
MELSERVKNLSDCQGKVSVAQVKVTELEAAQSELSSAKEAEQAQVSSLVQELYDQKYSIPTVEELEAGKYREKVVEPVVVPEPPTEAEGNAATRIPQP